MASNLLVMSNYWSNIHSDVFEYILKKLPLADVLRCRAVCREWRRVTRTHISSALTHSPLSLFLFKEFVRVEWSGSFVDVIWSGPNLVVDQESQQLLGGDVGVCVGYSHGWFLFVDIETESRLCLFHPLLSTTVAWFPPIANPDGETTIRINTAVLWADPGSASGNYGIVVIDSSLSQVLFAKCGSTQFVRLDDNQDPHAEWVYAICFNNCVYGVTLPHNGDHRIVSWDFNTVKEEEDSIPRMVLDFRPKIIEPPTSPLAKARTFYIVESEGELLFVSLQIPDKEQMKAIQEKDGIGFSELHTYARFPNMCGVFKMDFNEKKWVQMNSLGDRVLFVTILPGISLSIREFPQYQKNSIYYVPYLPEPVIAVYNLEDDSLKEVDIK